MEFAITVRLTNLGTEDEGCFCREDHVAEVRQALGCKSVKALAWGASYRCFTTDSLPQGYLGQLLGLQRMLNSMVNARDS
jgi:hypothetical protein